MAQFMRQKRQELNELYKKERAMIDAYVDQLNQVRHWYWNYLPTKWFSFKQFELTVE